MSQIFAILAFATTSGFDTEIKFNLTCREDTKGVPVYKASLPVEYPFNFEGQKMTVPKKCNSTEKEKETVDYSRMDFASSAQFFVATGVLSFLYSTGAIVLYIFGSRHYETNPLLPVIDLAITGVLTVFWLSGASAWAAGVSDVKYYTKASYLWSKMDFCDEKLIEDGDIQYCVEINPGKFTSLNISLVSCCPFLHFPSLRFPFSSLTSFLHCRQIFGFANIFLWVASCWFVFKETSFHKKPMPEEMGTGQPNFGQANFGQANPFGDQTAGQPQSQAHFPQQRQFADGY